MARILNAALVAVLVTTIGACGREGAGAPGSTWPEGRTFVSTEVTENAAPRPLVGGTPITLWFRPDRAVGATAGCNHLSGEGRLDDGRLVVTDLGGTLMGCDSARSEQDRWLGEFLGGKPTFSLTGDNLVLSRDNVQITFIDQRVADPAKPVIGTKWLVDTTINGEVAGSVPRQPEGRDPAQLTINADGSFGGSDGCNSFGGRAVVNGDRITFSDRTSTLVGCEGPGEGTRSTIERVLRGTVTYKIVGSFLTLTAVDQNIGLRLRAA